MQCQGTPSFALGVGATRTDLETWKLPELHTDSKRIVLFANFIKLKLDFVCVFVCNFFFR